MKEYISVKFQIFIKYFKFKNFIVIIFEHSQAQWESFLKILLLPYSQKEKGYAISMVTFN